MRKFFSARCWILVFLSLYVTVAHAQDSVPTHRVDGTFIKEWLVLGPFFPEDLETDFLASVNGEAFANPKPGDTVTTADGKTLTWMVYRSEGNLINLLHAVGNHREAVCYTFCLLESERGGDGEILVGSDDGVVVFFNGHKVHTQPVRRSIVVDEDRVAVSLRPGKNRCLMKVSNGYQNWALTARVFPPTRAVIAGGIANETGKPLSNATVHLWQGSTLIAKTETDSKGNYQFLVYPASGYYDIQATHRDKGNWKMGVQLSTGARVNMNLTLQKAISISGHLLTLDNTPHVGVLVEALSLGESGPRQRRVTTFSDKVGRYKFINLEPGLYQLRCHTPDAYSSFQNIIVSVSSEKTENIAFSFPPFKHGTWKNYTYLDGLGDNYIESIYQDREGFLWFGTSSGGVSRYDGEKFVNFTTDDGLVSNFVRTIHEDKSGHLWVGTWEVGVSRYDGEKFTNFTTEEGLVSNSVAAIHQDREGYIWFGTNGGVSRYDGEKFVNFTTDDGLASNFVRSIDEDKVGHLWFGTWEGGVSRYNGEKFINFTIGTGLAFNVVSVIHQDREGYIWFGTMGDGLSQYDSSSVINFTTADGLVSNYVYTIYQDREGYIWFGTDGGLSQYDGEKFINFTTDTGLVQDFVNSIYQDREGLLWFGTDGGVSQYDGEKLVNFTMNDELPVKSVWAIYQDREGYIWFGTGGGGISQYDGEKLVNFTTDDGLAQNYVTSIHQDREGFLWFGTIARGVSQYDGDRFINFTTDDGLASNSIRSIHEDKAGHLWFGTISGEGASRYDGEKFVNFTTNEGLVQDDVIPMTDSYPTLSERSMKINRGTFGLALGRLAFLDLPRPGGFSLVWDAQRWYLSIRWHLMGIFRYARWTHK
jgi:ligand-binding sensor domain-containing protein